MCGRYELRGEDVDFTLYGIEDDVEAPQRTNIKPSESVLIVRGCSTIVGQPRRELVSVKWGLVPSWSKDEKSGFKMINARAETVAEKPSYRNAIKSRRCLIPATGFYEWQKQPVGKSKPFIFRTGGQFAIAGIWEPWHDLETCSILTTVANEVVSPVHERMPVLLDANDYGVWVEGPLDGALKLLRPFPASRMTSEALVEVV